MSEWGVYENLNPTKRRGPPPNKNGGRNSNNLNSASGDTECWFSKSFTKAGGLSSSSEQLQLAQTQDPEVPRKKVEELRKSFEGGSSKASGALLVKNRAYKGSKTTGSLLGTNSDDWDFLTTLNDILREENFLVEDSKSKGKGSESNANATATPQPQPLSPKPPRPARRADRDRRKADYTKTRSMDAGEALKNTMTFDYSNPPVIPPPRCYQNIRPDLTNNLSKGSTNNLSSSLDSIYDRLNPNPIGNGGYDPDPRPHHHHNHNDIGGYCYPFSGSGSRLNSVYRPYALPPIPVPAPATPWTHSHNHAYGSPTSHLGYGLSFGYGPNWNQPQPQPELLSRSYGSFKVNLLTRHVSLVGFGVLEGFQCSFECRDL
jgi:hypothetical protein